MKIVRALLGASSDLSLRELVDLTQMSPAGLRDALRRLKEANVVTETRSGNKCLYRAQLNLHEKAFLCSTIEEEIEHELRHRAELFSSRSEAAIQWIDDMLEIIRDAKSANNHSA